MTRPASAVVDLRALRANYLHARAMHGGRVAAVLKANAYGHGAVHCARALADVADAFAVAFTEEAMALRQAGITAPIWVLEGAFAMDDLALASQHGLWMVVHHAEQVKMLEQFKPCRAPVGVWLKIDTGMHRAGVDPSEVVAVWSRLKACDAVASICLMTHLSSADEPDSAATGQQLECFRASTAGLPGARSVANSAGMLAWPAARMDWGRAGIMLYGADPLGQGSGLQAVMSLNSEVFAQRWIEPGEAVGYGQAFVADRRTRVGLVAMGYADGYPRRVPTGTPVAVGGQLVRTIGRVSMDMLTVDLSEHPMLGIGSPVELWGSQVSVNEVAAAAGAIAYELLCNVKRVPLSYIAPDAQTGGKAYRADAGLDAAAQKITEPETLIS